MNINQLHGTFAALLLAMSTVSVAQTIGDLQDECMTAMKSQLEASGGMRIVEFRGLRSNAPLKDGKYVTCGWLTAQSTKSSERMTLRFIYQQGQGGGVVELWMTPEEFAKSWKLCSA